MTCALSDLHNQRFDVIVIGGGINGTSAAQNLAAGGYRCLLVDKGDLAKTFVLRRILNPMGTTDAIEFLLSKLKQTKTNSEFFDSMNT